MSLLLLPLGSATGAMRSDRRFVWASMRRFQSRSALLSMIILTVIVNDSNNCSVSNVLSCTLNTRNETRIAWSVRQQNPVIILKSDLIIGSEYSNFSTIPGDGNWV